MFVIDSPVEVTPVPVTTMRSPVTNTSRTMPLTGSQQVDQREADARGRPGVIGTDTPATRQATLHAMADLVDRVNRALGELGWKEDPVDSRAVERVLDGVFVPPRRREPVDPAKAPTDMKGRAVWIAHQISGREFGLKGAGSGPEFERFWQVLLPLLDGESARNYRKFTLARNRRLDIRVEVEQKRYFHGADDKFYLDKTTAANAGINEGEYVNAAIIEDVAGPLRTLDEEHGYPQVDPVFDEIKRTEDSLIRHFRDGGSPVQLSEIFRPELGYELTYTGQASSIGPPVIGESAGVHVHHTQGIPLPGLVTILDRIRAGSYPERATGAVNRDAIADGLMFGRELAGGFVRWWAAKERWQVAPALNEETLADKFWLIPKVRALWGVAALAYTHAAGIANYYIKGGVFKRNFDVISRNDPSVLLGGLDRDVREYLHEHIIDVLASFCRRYEERAPDWRAQYSEPESPALRDPENPNWRPSAETTVSSLRIPTLRRETIADYLCAALFQGYKIRISHFEALGTTTVKTLDDHSGGLSVPQAVIEIRHYGNERVDVETARQHHKELADIARREYAAVVAATSSPSQSASYLESLWQSVQPSQDVRLVEETSDVEGQVMRSSWGAAAGQQVTGVENFEDIRDATFGPITDPADPRIGSGHGPPADTGNHALSQIQQWITTIQHEWAGAPQTRHAAHTLQQIDETLFGWHAHVILNATEPVLELRKLLAAENAIETYQHSHSNSLNSQSVHLLDGEIKQRREVVENQVLTHLQQIDLELAPYVRRMPAAPIYSQLDQAQVLTAPRDHLNRISDDSIRDYLQACELPFEMVRSEMQYSGVFVGQGVRDSQIHQLVAQDQAGHNPTYPELSRYLRRQDGGALEDKATPLDWRQPYYVTIHGKNIWVDSDPTDGESSAERLAVFAEALGLFLSAGYFLPDEIKLFLPKYGRQLTIDDQLEINVNDGFLNGAYAAAMAPNMLVINPEITPPSAGSAVSLYSRPDIGAIIHELFHIWHAHINPGKYVDLGWAELVDEVKAIVATQVSPDAAIDPRKAVAEMGVAMILGSTNFPPELMRMLDALV